MGAPRRLVRFVVGLVADCREVSLDGPGLDVLEQLEDLLSRPTFYAVALLRVDPTWRELRPLPGFQAMLERHATDGITTAVIDHR